VVAAALAAFESARYRRTARVQLYARFYGELYHAAGVAREVRNEMLAGNSRGLEGMAWLYEGPQFAAAALAAAGTV
jgi:salicylate hydroxylase